MGIKAEVVDLQICNATCVYSASVDEEWKVVSIILIFKKDSEGRGRERENAHKHM